MAPKRRKKMIQVPINEEMVARVASHASAMGTLRNSFTKGEGNVIGFMGEELVLASLEDSKKEESYDFDIIFEGKRFEVKTKRTTVEPKPHYMCSVSTFNTRQKADYYLFCRVLHKGGSFGDFGWVLGYIPVEEFKRGAVFMRKGDLDRDNGYIVRSNCFSVPISDLYPVEGLMI